MEEREKEEKERERVVFFAFIFVLSLFFLLKRIIIHHHQIGTRLSLFFPFSMSAWARARITGAVGRRGVESAVEEESFKTATRAFFASSSSVSCLPISLSFSPHLSLSLSFSPFLFFFAGISRLVLLQIEQCWPSGKRERERDLTRALGRPRPPPRREQRRPSLRFPTLASKALS